MGELNHMHLLLLQSLSQRESTSNIPRSWRTVGDYGVLVSRGLVREVPALNAGLRKFEITDAGRAALEEADQQ